MTKLRNISVVGMLLTLVFGITNNIQCMHRRGNKAAYRRRGKTNKKRFPKKGRRKKVETRNRARKRQKLAGETPSMNARLASRRRAISPTMLAVEAPIDPLIVVEQKEQEFRPYQARRIDLAKKVRGKHPEVKNGLILLFASFEEVNEPFRQDNAFYYFTGLEASGIVIAINMEGFSTLLVPNCVENQKKWIGTAIEPGNREDFEHFLLDSITFLGKTVEDIQVDPYFEINSHENLLQIMGDTISQEGTLFVLYPKESTYQHVNQRFVFDRLKKFLRDRRKDPTDIPYIDISPIADSMRRVKDAIEIKKTKRAISITKIGHARAAKAIRAGATEHQIKAELEYPFIAIGTSTAYPSIIAAGKNGPFLHHHGSSYKMKDGDVILIDAAAKFDNYRADITRTYPVSGKFTSRQRELYLLVLATQRYIASIAKPGYFPMNRAQPDKCLTHLARAFLDSKHEGYGARMTHGVGHYLGLDVHDVGSYKDPLEPGVVITIEPGIYLPEEEIGIRIEDNYVVTQEGVTCLSSEIPKEPDEIEAWMQS